MKKYVVIASIVFMIGGGVAHAADSWSANEVKTLSDGSKVIDTGGATIPLAALPTGGIGVTNCMPPGPRTFLHPGRDGLPCAATGLSAGLFVTGICQGGFCRATSFSSSQGVLSSFLQGVGRSAITGLAQQLLGGMFGGGSYYSPYETPTTTDPLDISFDDLATSTPLTGYDFTFGDYDNRTTLTYDTVPPTIDTINTPTVQPVTITQQLYNTQASSQGGVATIPGSNQFEQDLLGITFDTDSQDASSQTLSLADLERAAYEARMREAALQGQGTDTSGLSSYRGSSLGQRPAINSGDSSTEERPWWIAVVEFVGSLFGL